MAGHRAEELDAYKAGPCCLVQEGECFSAVEPREQVVQADKEREEGMVESVGSVDEVGGCDGSPEVEAQEELAEMKAAAGWEAHVDTDHSSLGQTSYCKPSTLRILYQGPYMIE